MQGDKVLQDGVELVESNKIKAVGSKAEVASPGQCQGDRHLAAKPLCQGLFDAHAHGSQGVNQSIQQQNYSTMRSLALGVTSIDDHLTTAAKCLPASEMQKTGAIVGPRIFSTGTILYGAYGAGYTSHIDSLADAKFHWND